MVSRASRLGECGGYALATRCAHRRAGVLPCLSLKALLVNQEEAFQSAGAYIGAVERQDGCIASDVFEQLTVAEDFPSGVTFVASRMPALSSSGAPRHRECVDT